MTTAARPFPFASLTTWSLAALVAGLLVGMVGHASESSGIAALAEALKPLGNLWVAALQMIVLPLVITHMLAAIAGVRGNESVGGLGGRAVLLFVVLLGIGALFTLALAPPIISRYTVNPATIASLQAATPVPDAVRQAALARPESFGDWIAGLVPSNLFEAALRGDILALLLFTVLFALAVRRVPQEYRDPLTTVFQGLAAAMLICVRWMLWFTPVGVFVFSLLLGVTTGGAGAGMLGAFVVIVSGLMLLFTLLLYPVSAVLGRTSMGVFARAVAPAQLIAVSTRSSIAALPALVEGGRDCLRLPESATGFVLPLSVSLFKVNRTISSTVKLLFIARLYGVPLSAAALATFILTVILMSFSNAGVPGGGSAFKTLPAYLAAGVPIEGVVIVEVVDMIPDIFKTLLNVTGDMSVATLLSRSSRPARGAVQASDRSPAATGAS